MPRVLPARLAAVLLGALLLLGLPASPAAAAPALTTCRVDQRPPGGTAAFALGLSTVRTPCAVGTGVMAAYHRCRTPGGARCTRPVLGRWRCATKRNRGEFAARTVACTARNGRRVFLTYTELPGRCFGAAARDRLTRCRNDATRSFPGLDRRDPYPYYGCSESAGQGCLFGDSTPGVRRHVAIFGDSHVTSWRAALRGVLVTRRTLGHSLTSPGCFFNDVVGDFFAPCVEAFETQKSFLRDHPEITTLFLAANADTKVHPDPQVSYDRKVAGYLRSFRLIAPTVRRVIVLRDLPRFGQRTFDCLAALERVGRVPLAGRCTAPRSEVLLPDPAADAAERIDDPRFSVIDLSRYVCDARECDMVVGGLTVNADVLGHVSYTFMSSLTPFLYNALVALERRGR